MPLSKITKYLEEIEPFGATLIAVSKTKSDEIIQRIYEETRPRPRYIIQETINLENS